MLASIRAQAQLSKRNPLVNQTFVTWALLLREWHTWALCLLVARVCKRIGTYTENAYKASVFQYLSFSTVHFINFHGTSSFMQIDIDIEPTDKVCGLNHYLWIGIIKNMTRCVFFCIRTLGVM